MNYQKPHSQIIKKRIGETGIPWPQFLKMNPLNLFS